MSASLTIDFVTLLPYLVPLAILQYSLMVWALVSLLRTKAPPKHLQRWVWVLIIVLVSTIGPILFLALGRSQDE